MRQILLMALSSVFTGLVMAILNRIRFGQALDRIEKMGTAMIEASYQKGFRAGFKACLGNLEPEADRGQS